MRKLLLTILSTLALASTLCATAPAALQPSPAARHGGDGSPMPTCTPGKNCDDDQLQLLAGDGSPMPTCTPGSPGCPGDQNLRPNVLVAGDGSPMPTCTPGKNCNDDQERQVLTI